MADEMVEATAANAAGAEAVSWGAEAAMASLARGSLDRVRAEDVDTGSRIRVKEKDQDRYLLEITLGGVGREEWRSGVWIRMMLERGLWRLFPLPPGVPVFEAPAAPAIAAPGAASDAGIRIRRPLRGGGVEIALPSDVTPGEAQVALAEIERIAAFVRTLC
jgi:hypothetical protein